MSVEASVPLRRLVVITMVLSVGVGLGFLEDGLAQSMGQMTLAVTLSLSPLCFDPAETPVTGNSYAFLSLLHDALIEPFPEKAVPSFAWRSPGRRVPMGYPSSSGCARV